MSKFLELQLFPSYNTLLAHHFVHLTLSLPNTCSHNTLLAYYFTQLTLWPPDNSSLNTLVTYYFAHLTFLSHFLAQHLQGFNRNLPITQHKQSLVSYLCISVPTHNTYSIFPFIAPLSQVV